MVSCPPPGRGILHVARYSSILTETGISCLFAVCKNHDINRYCTLLLIMAACQLRSVLLLSDDGLCHARTGDSGMQPGVPDIFPD